MWLKLLSKVRCLQWVLQASTEQPKYFKRSPRTDALSALSSTINTRTTNRTSADGEFQWIQLQLIAIRPGRSVRYRARPPCLCYDDRGYSPPHHPRHQAARKSLLLPPVVFLRQLVDLCPIFIPRNHCASTLGDVESKRLQTPGPAPAFGAVGLRANIYDENGPIEYAYFPTTGVISAVTTMEDGTAIEVATIGNEGMAGLPALIEAGSSPNRLFVQVAGHALRISAEILCQECDSGKVMRKIFHLYQNAFLIQVSQSVACNGLHTVQQRCCRWLLITHDRVSNGVLPLTHELLSIMLGVRRQSVTEVLQGIQAKGCISYNRGKIQVTDRNELESLACECYRKVKLQYDRLLGPAKGNTPIRSVPVAGTHREVCCPSSWASPMRIPSGPRM